MYIMFIGTSGALKQVIHRRHRTREIIPWRLLEFIWLRKQRSEGRDAWDGLMHCFKTIEFNPSTMTEEEEEAFRLFTRADANDHQPEPIADDDG